MHTYNKGQLSDDDNHHFISIYITIYIYIHFFSTRNNLFKIHEKEEENIHIIYIEREDKVNKYNLN